MPRKLSLIEAIDGSNMTRPFLSVYFRASLGMLLVNSFHVLGKGLETTLWHDLEINHIL